MINILLAEFDIDASWLYEELKNYIQPNSSVAVVAFSFRDNHVNSLSDWNAFLSVDFKVCPVHCYDITKDNWYKTEQGVNRVLGELS